MRRVLAIVLLVLLPLQFSWAAVAAYCGHETQAAVAHFGHHQHRHLAEASDRAALDTDATAGAAVSPDAADGQAPGALDLDCGHCHGSCSAMPAWPLGLAGAVSTAQPGATLDAAGGAHAPTRPERPQWLPLA